MREYRDFLIPREFKCIVIILCTDSVEVQNVFFLIYLFRNILGISSLRRIVFVLFVVIVVVVIVVVVIVVVAVEGVGVGKGSLEFRALL